jgi:drug/metabolite transporter (DMT)-like permease
MQDPSAASRPQELRLLGAFSCVFLVWGSNFLAIRYMVETIPPLMAMGVRSVMAGLILFGWARLRGADRPDASEWKAAALVGAFLFLGAHGALAWGQTRVPSGIAALVMATIPVWLVLIDWLGAKGTRPAPGTWLGLACGVAGLVVLTDPRTIQGPGSLAGFLVLATSAPCWAIGSIIARDQPKRRPLTMIAGMQLTTGGTLLLIASVVAGEFGGFDVSAVSARSLAALGYTTLFGSVLTLTAYLWLLTVVSAAVVGIYAFVNPMIAVALGWAFAGEVVTMRVVFAGALILLGVLLLSSRSERRILHRSGREARRLT